MLAVMALQGTGFLHGLHMAVEHAPASGRDHGSAEPTHTSDEVALTVRDGQGSGHGHGHHRDPATCPVCQTLAALKSVVVGPNGGLSTRLPPVLRIGTLGNFPLPQIALLTLGPRAPPVC